MTHSVSNPKGRFPDSTANKKAPEYILPVHLTAEPGGILPKETSGAQFRSGLGEGHSAQGEEKTGGTVTDGGAVSLPRQHFARPRLGRLAFG